MKNSNRFLKNSAAALLILVIMLTGSTVSIGQTYAKMRITTNQGTLIEGKKGSVGKDAAVLTVDDSQKSIPLSDIQFITTKRGSAYKYCLGFGGGCLAIGLATTAVNPNGDDASVLLLGSAIWAGIFGGVGALIGLATDPWETVYFGRRQESVSRFKFQLDTDYRGKPMLGLAYSF
jgi:hypothetical protein